MACEGRRNEGKGQGMNQMSEPTERGAWLAYVRRRCEWRMDNLIASTYDERWGGYINPTHQAMVEKMLALLPPRAAVLDAACGTGKYWPLLLAAGCVVVGCDQSAGMLAQARAKFPAVHASRCALQDIVTTDVYAGVLCVDAMENISPEDWPIVLPNLARALVPGGLLYLTVELEDADVLDIACLAASDRGLPVVPGEVAHEGSYHYYPALAQVRAWFADVGLHILYERTGDGYQHFLAHKPEDG